MNDGYEKVYKDVPIPERRRENHSPSRSAGRTDCTLPLQKPGRKSPEVSGGTGQGRSPWNYITEEDLLRNFGGNFTDSYREGRLKEQEQYQAFREQVKSGQIPGQPYVTRVRYARRWASELLGPDREESPEEGYRILERFGQVLPDGFTLSGYPADTLKEIRKYYVIVADLPRSYVAEAFADEIAEDEKILALIMYPEADPDQLYRSISGLGRYRGEKSHFFQEHAEEMKAVLARVYCDWADAYEEKYKKPLSDDLLGESDTRPWYPWQALHMSLPSASRKKKMVFLVDPVLVYWCKSGSWTITQYFPNIYGSKLRREQLGQICRETERLLRDAAGYRKLKPADMDEELKKLVGRTVAAYLKDKEEAEREAARPRIQIDLSRLSGIRSDADYTRDQLLEGAEDELAELPGYSGFGKPEENSKNLQTAVKPEENSQVLQAAGKQEENSQVLQTAVKPEENFQNLQTARQNQKQKADSDADGNEGSDSYGLTPDEKEVLQQLLDGGDPSDYIRSHNLFASILADSINEKLFDEIGDSVLEETDQGLALIEDYKEDLRLLF